VEVLSQAEILWELLEVEAPIKFYINDAKKPAFLLFPKYHWASSKSKVTLYMNLLGKIREFTSEKKALAFLKEKIENHSIKSIKVYIVYKYGRRAGKKILFAESKNKG